MQKFKLLVLRISCVKHEHTFSSLFADKGIIDNQTVQKKTVNGARH